MKRLFVVGLILLSLGLSGCTQIEPGIHPSIMLEESKQSEDNVQLKNVWIFFENMFQQN